MSSLHSCTDVQYECVQFVNLVLFHNFGQNILKVEGKLEIERLYYFWTSIFIVFKYTYSGD